MLTQDQANAAAEALLAIERASADKARHERAGRVPFYARSPESARLHRWQEWALYQQARGSFRDCRVIAGYIAYLAYLASVASIWLFVISHSIGTWHPIGFFIAILAPHIIRVVYIRRTLSRLAADFVKRD